jgi:2-haloalkanoic acid dehalogenase type II
MESLTRPALFTFDIFGTVLDWRAGMRQSLAQHGIPLTDALFGAIIDHQGASEQTAFRSYREITARSLVEVAGLRAEDADAIGASLGHWPLYADSPQGMRALAALAPTVAMTNSDRAHRPQVEAQLGAPLHHWFCAEDVRCYKPDPRFWREVSARLGHPLDRSWWHVSAYADYDLDVARTLGLTAVFIERPHARPGAHDVKAPNLVALAELAKAATSLPKG